MVNEARYALRALLRTPLVTGAAVITLALAIGANSALYNLLEVALIRPLPFWEPERLATVESRRVETGVVDQSSAADYLDWRRETRAFSSLAAWREWGMALTGVGEPEELGTVRVTSNLFQVLGVAPALGRNFGSEEELRGHRVTIISHGFWQEQLGGDPGVLGRSLTLDGLAYQIIGVMPAGFRFPDRDEVRLWTPMAFDSIELSHRVQRMFDVIGRLQPGVSLADAQSELAGISATFPPSPSGGTWSVQLRPAREAFQADGKPLLLLMAAVVLILLIGCANVANLMLARGLGRTRATALRAALGAGRGRLLQLPLLESLWLGLLSGVAGLGLSLWLSDLLLTLQPGLVPHWHPVTLSAPVLLFAGLLSLIVAFVVGILPALRSWTPNLANLLREGTERGTEGVMERRLRVGLVAGQVALAFLLAVGGLLLIRTLDRLSRVNPGFTPNHLLASSISLSDTRFPDDASQHLAYARMLEGLQTVPGVLSVAMVTTLPMNPVGIDHDLSVTITGATRPPDAEPPQVDFRIASPAYFRTLGVPLVRGREFTEQDRAGAPGAMVINQTMARQLFVGDPIGQEVTIPGGRYTVVGIARDVRHRGLDIPARAEMFVPLAQYYAYGSMNLLVRTMGDVGAASTAIRRAVHAVDPDQPVGTVHTMAELVGDSIAGRRFIAWLLGALTLLGLVLAALGVYAVMAVNIAQRRQELGIRLALGASPGRLARSVVRDALGMVLPGLVVGLVATLFATRLLRAQLYEVSPFDGVSLAGAALLLLAVGLLAGWLPARRAARLSPLTTLREGGS
jgi:putative ABC transport system permease protein